MSASTYDITSDLFYADPSPTLHRMRSEAPLYWHPDIRAWVLTRYEHVQHVVRSEDFSVARSGSIAAPATEAVAPELAWCSEFVLQWMVFADRPLHTKLRASVAEAFRPHNVDRLHRSIEELAEDLIGRLGQRADILAEVAVPLPGLVTCRMLGLPLEDAERFKVWTGDMFRLFAGGVASEEVVRRAHSSLRESCTYFAKVIEQRRAQPGDDLLSVLISTQRAAPTLTEVELLAMCVTLVAGGFETSSNLIGNGLLALLRHPDQLEALRSNPDLIDNAVEELMRFDGPAVSLVRDALANVEIDGVQIRQGERVLCMVYGANRDPEQFANPDRLDLSRANAKRHLGLGYGPHFCIGAALARKEATSVLSKLVQRFPAMRLDRDALRGGEPQWVPNPAMRGVHSLPVLLQ